MKKMLAFFGAFNPPTLAHLELAHFALDKTGREGVLFVPSKSVYIRNEQGKDFAFSDAERLSMLRSAAGERPWMQVTDWEIKQPYQPRTYETLCHLRDEGIDAALLLGSDKLPELEKGWRSIKEIAQERGIVCLSRGGDDCRAMIDDDPFLSSLSPYILVLETPAQFQSVSSTAVRRRLAAMQELKDELSAMVPKEICALLMGKFR
ncbi:MAG: nicotinate-nicotinamide nucleotide adenylyltransferase [Clostridia bacterium]|nr:nicotinate-nicotinamide nucleotide adenylyltransferase [Clostridia bacterium]